MTAVSHILTSNIPRFAGKVYLHQVVTLPMVRKYEEIMLEGGRELRAALDAAKVQPSGRMLTNSAYHSIILPGVLVMVEKFEIPGMPEQPTIEDFPYRPPKQAALFIAWLVQEIDKYLEEDGEDPNA